MPLDRRVAPESRIPRLDNPTPSEPPLNAQFVLVEETKQVQGHFASAFFDGEMSGIDQA